MLNYPQIDPVALQLGPLKVHWYGVMYFVGLIIAFIVAKRKTKQPAYTFFAGPQVLDDLLSYCVLGIIIGGRLGFCFLYQPHDYITHPLDIFKIWMGGMSFHGGMVGVFVAVYLFAKKHHKSFFTISDFIAPLVPFGLFTGRMGNFINGELYGKLCQPIHDWCMIFPNTDGLARHPSQLYEAFGEGLVLLLILYLYSRTPRKTGQNSAVFLLGYGTIRFTIELFRSPDSYAQWVVTDTGLSLGQWYCVPMLIGGVIIYMMANNSKFNDKR